MRADMTQVLDASRPIGPQVYWHLRQRIILGQLLPGVRLSEAEIAQEQGVSRQPVREGFIKLADEGLVEVRPQRGTFVCKINVAAVMDARFVREAIEADICKLLADARDVDLVATLRSQIGLQAQAANAKDYMRFTELDELFHRTLAEATGKTHAWRMIEGIRSQMDRVRFLSAQHFPMERLVTQHVAVVDGIEAGSAQQADTAMRMHLREILEDLPQIVADHSDLFEDKGAKDG